ncbi:MAG: type IV pilus assembly protein PilM [Tissierellia bacterium]|nr:type IV pilus assembly protein PilM [Tissierellia bacterium]
MELNLPRSQRVLAMDIGAHSIKIIEGKETKKGIVVSKYFTIDTPEGVVKDGLILDKELMHYVVSEKLRKKKIKTKNIYITINSSNIITREISIPKVAEDEIHSLLMFQMEDYLPVNIEDYVFQHKVLDVFYEDNMEKMNLLIIAIPKEVVEGYFYLLKGLGLNPLVMDYQPNSIAKLIDYNDFINNTFSTEDITFAIIDIGYDSTKISIVKNGKILVSRLVEIAGNYIDQSILNFNDISLDEVENIKGEIDNINRINEDSSHSNALNIIKSSIVLLSEKIEMVFKYYLSRKPDNIINYILLTGGISNIKGLDNMFTNIFNIPSISIEALDKVDFEGNFALYANAIGSIIRF